MKVLRYRQYDKRAEISVFISLLCVSVCAFVYVVIESAKINAVMFKMEALADIAVRSCFSEYCKPLLDEYALLYVDTAYKTPFGGSNSFLDHVSAYITVNAYAEGMTALNISYVDGLISDAVYASDNNYESLRKQIISVMKSQGYVGDNKELLQDYIEVYFPDNVERSLEANYTDYADKDASNIPEKTEDELLKEIIDLISAGMEMTYSHYFEFSNLLEGCETTVILNGNGKEYEKTIKYSLFVQ